MLNILISIVFYLTALCTFIIIGPLFVISSFILSDFLMYKMSKFVCYITLCSLGVRIEKRGKIPIDGSLIYMFNHGSFIDAFIFAQCTKGPCTALVAKENYDYPIWKSMLKRWKAIPINRENKDEAIKSIERAQEVINQGFDIIILPEGTRTITGKMKRFKKGGFHMAYNTKTPIQPVGCIGAFEFKPKNRWTISPRKVIVNFGEMITPDTYEALGVEGLIRKTENEIKKLTNGKFEDEE